MAEHSDDMLKIGEWLVDPSLDTIRRGTETQKLEPRTMRLLICLAGAPGSVISVDRLLTEVWAGVVVGPASVYQAVSQLRRLLGDTDEKPTYIANVPRKGYRLIAPVLRVTRTPAFREVTRPVLLPAMDAAGAAAPPPAKDAATSRLPGLDIAAALPQPAKDAASPLPGMDIAAASLLPEMDPAVATSPPRGVDASVGASPLPEVNVTAASPQPAKDAASPLPVMDAAAASPLPVMDAAAASPPPEMDAAVAASPPRVTGAAVVAAAPLHLTEAAGPASPLPLASARGGQAPPRSRRTLFGIAVLVILLAAAALWKILQTFNDSGAGVASIVVLPFVDLTENKSDQPFCDGLTEELSNWLAQIPTLRVVARTSAFAFRGQAQDVRKIGRELNTNHVLEGSMRRSGDSVRVTVQLIDARNGYHLWSANFDQPMDDSVKLQEKISLSVARSMQVRLSGETLRQLLARGASDPQAYQLYLLSRYSAQQSTSAATDREIELLRQALMTAPAFSLAHTELAYALVNQSYYHDQPVATVADEVESHIRSALQADPRLSSAYAALGTLRAFQGRYEEAFKDLHYAITLNPSDVGAIAQIGRIKLVLGLPREALSTYTRAVSLDPLNAILYRQQCVSASALGQYEQAEAACLKGLKLAPRNSSISEDLAWLAESHGRLGDALTRNADAIDVEPDQFNLYWDRATFLLSVNLAPAARSVIERGRLSARDEESASTALMRVVYAEGGTKALKDYIANNHLDQSTHATTLFEAAYGHLLLGDGSTARALLERARAAPDRTEGYAEQQWYALGENTSISLYRLELAAAHAMSGDRASANRELNAVRDMLDQMIAAGVDRYATYELRAKTYALLGRNDDAMKDLAKSVKLGWRQEWWATHEPYFASLQSRGDFQTLMSQVRRANYDMIQTIQGRELFTLDAPALLVSATL